MLKMNKRYSIVILSIITNSINSCHIQNTPTTKTISHDNYTEQEVLSIKRKLENTQFPQEEGFVQALLKKGSRLKMRSASFTLADEGGRISLDPSIVELNNTSTLLVYKDYYPSGNSPMSTDKVITGVKFITK